MTIDPQRLPPIEQRALALAGLVQSALLVEHSAFGKNTPESGLSLLYQSVYITDPNDFKDIVPEMEALTPGIRFLQQMLQKQPDESEKRILSYVLNVIQLERKLCKRSDLLDTLGQALQQLQARYADPEDRLQPNAIADLAELYRDTVGQLQPRIEVRGDASHLQNPSEADKIRSLLLTGIRFSMLWRQLGGRRWHLVFSQRQILANLNQLYDRLCANQVRH